MYALPYPFDHRQHCVLKGSELSGWLTRNFPGQNLLLYKHLKEGTFVIAQRHGDGQMVDVMNLGTSLATMDRVRAGTLRFLFSGLNTTNYLKTRIQEGYSKCLSYYTEKGHEAEDVVHRKTPRSKTSVLV